jgi:hypothetical protein
MAAIACVVPASGQVAGPQSLVLETRSASRALDAIPAVFAVAKNLENVEIDVGVEGMASGFSDLANHAAAQEQLVAALGAYGFESYGDWAATTQTIFATYTYIEVKGATAPPIAEAVDNVLNDPGLPERQKELIKIQVEGIEAKMSDVEVPSPSQTNLEVVIALMPQISTTIEMMQAMQ